ncbi:iron chelate uptake ABC transporter family permease subunit [Aerococcaceae bacterium DSM 109653]|uniref:Iron chelate uptake ABC transporter family permease subunit n=1 Tax=Fundicoccus ignavus TaxID=2664442 RepID=A0A844BH84_9LACT|nr:metal ABC transporter permease [Fundicoccus ignavus]MRI81340.1 iron chelate uptake ABC transporter family permease subunit [Fundicoccus ignavus]
MLSQFSFDYFFWIVALGTMVLGFTSGLIGTSLVLEKQSQLGDAIGHAVYPGVIITFMLFQTRNTAILLVGAVVFGLIAFSIIQLIRRYTDFPYESILALVLSAFFSLGLLLYNVVQRNPQFQTVNFAGLNNYIMGQAAFLMWSDVRLIIIVSVVVVAVFMLLYPKIKLYLFDSIFAQTIGINNQWISHLLLLMCLLVIAVGLQAVGAKLISSMLVAPAIAAQQWTQSYGKMLGLAGVFGMVASFIGTLLSTTISNIATGPMIVVVLTAIALLSLVFGTKGILADKLYTSHKEVSR